MIKCSFSLVRGKVVVLSGAYCFACLPSMSPFYTVNTYMGTVSSNGEVTPLHQQRP